MNKQKIEAALKMLDAQGKASHELAGLLREALAEEAAPAPAAKRKIDWSKMPKDTLVEVRADISDAWAAKYFSCEVKHGFYCYGSGGTSLTAKDTTCWPSIRLIENEPKPWFGGECPVPEGVMVKAWLRGDRVSLPYQPARDAKDWIWGRHYGTPGEIIAFQILGPMEGWE